jgi:energy-coupling factor transporter transmembrane protein EcfT
MAEKENLGSFIRENGQLARDWVETKLALYKLTIVRGAAKIAGRIVWSIVSFLMFVLFLIFLGITAGLWLSTVTGSQVMGFGIVTLFFALLLLILVVFRKKIFIDPLIRAMIASSTEDPHEPVPYNKYTER